MAQSVKMSANLGNLLEIRLFSKLTENLLADVKKLVRDCKALDGFESPFHWDCVEHRKNPFIHEILCYMDQTLVGYMALYYFKEKEVEITLVIHPEYRQIKVLRLIWEQIKLTVHRNKIETEFYTFTIHQKDECIINVLKEAEANKVSQVYKLVLSQKGFIGVRAKIGTGTEPEIEIDNDNDNKTIQIRSAEITDKASLIELECACFGTNAKAYHDNLEFLFRDSKQMIFVLEDNKVIIGKAHYKIEGNEAFLFDFCIKPSEQSKGFGNILLKQSLQEVFNKINPENNLPLVNKVYLETDSPNFLKWYKKIGFKEMAIFEHWKLYYPGFIKFHDQQYRSLVLNHYQEYDLLA